MSKVLFGAAMRAADEYAMQVCKIPGLLLMEAAARSVVERLTAQCTPGGRVLVFCGMGNNGGAGFAIARMLKQKGLNVKIFLNGDPDRLRGDALTNYSMLSAYKIPVLRQDQVYILDSLIDQSEWLVDALFGTGLARDIAGLTEQIIHHINRAREENGSKVMAVDIPSGIDADSGQIRGCAVQADETVTFVCKKPGLMLYPGKEYAGHVTVADIGIPDSVPALEEEVKFTLERGDIPALLPARYNRSHKGSYGRLLMAAGSRNMTGAAILSARSAYKTGVGLVDMAIPKEIRPVIQTSLPEVVITPYEIIKETVDCGSTIEQSSLAPLREQLAICSAVLAGPGWSQVCYVQELLGVLLDTTPSHIPMVLDADALNILASRPEMAEKVCRRGGHTILTPHLGEAARLLQKPVQEISGNLMDSVRQLTEKYNACVALKDAVTLVASPEGKLYINQTGNHGMATAGSGDVLAGIIAGLAAQGLSAFKAAYLGVYLHGAAGDLAAQKEGAYSMTASDICRNLHLETSNGFQK